MDALAATIAQILDYVHTQGPEAIAQLTSLLVALKAGVGVLGLLSGFAAQVPATLPAVAEIVTQLIALISAGAGIGEIAPALGQLATVLGLSIDNVVQILQAIGALLVAF